MLPGWSRLGWRKLNTCRTNVATGAWRRDGTEDAAVFLDAGKPAGILICRIRPGHETASAMNSSVDTPKNLASRRAFALLMARRPARISLMVVRGT